MKGFWTMIAVLGFMSVAGCYESYQNYGDGRGDDSFPIVTCEIAVTATPAEANITVDGISVRGTVELTTGSHVFTATVTGYFPASQTVEVTEACAPVELALFPDVRGDWDITFVHIIEDRLIMRIAQSGEILQSYDFYSDPTHRWQNFDGSILGDGTIHFLSDDSVRVDMNGTYLAPDRLEGRWTAAPFPPGDVGTWTATRRR